MVLPTFTAPSEGGIRINSPYPSAIALASFSLLSVILIFPALFQHYRNRNVGATVLVASALCANLMITSNAMIWSNDDMSNWYRGLGYCDIQVKLIIFLGTSVPAAISCILRALANVMDTNRSSWMQTTSQRRRGYVIDLVCCVGIPTMLMALSYIYQAERYGIMGISGCQFQKDNSWVAFIFAIMPPLLWSLVGVYYAVLILVRLVRYRRSFSSVLANSNTTKSRFIRLYGVCVIVVLGQLPVSIYNSIVNLQVGIQPFSWNSTHHNPDLPWNSAILVASHGAIWYDRFVWLVGAYIAFFFFGFGKDAMKTYRDMLLAMGFGRMFPALRPDYQRSGSITGTISSFSSKAKAFLQRQNSHPMWTHSTSSTLTDVSTPLPKKMTFLESIDERSRLPIPVTTTRQKIWNPVAGLTGIFQKKNKQSVVPADTFAATNTDFLATVSAEAPSPTTIHARIGSVGQNDVLVTKEVRQASETAETLPSKMYEGV